jgi:hypothetical protein
VNSWDGCRDGVDCNLCDNKLCTTCADFAESAVCTVCVENAEVVTDDCQCDSKTAHDTVNNTCRCVDECEECTQLDKFHCQVCASNNYKVPNTTFCLDYCPFNYQPNGSQCVGLDSR